MQSTVQAEWERTKAFEAACRTEFKKYPADSAAVIRARVAVKQGRPLWLSSHVTVAGPIDAVKAYVGMVLETDGCTPMYEHMLWRLGAPVVENGVAIVDMTKSHYAGD